MTLAEVRKFVVAVCGAIAGTVPQVLATFSGVISPVVASWATIVAIFATAILVYLVPNGPSDRLSRLRAAAIALRPAFDEFGRLRRLQRESGAVAADATGPARREPTYVTDPFDPPVSTPYPKIVTRTAEPAPAPAAPVDTGKPDTDPDPFTVPPVGRP